jgi:hypothetical protein
MVAHMQEEEQIMLPQLSAVLDVETQLRLGILFEAAKVSCAEPATAGLLETQHRSLDPVGLLYYAPVE